MSIAAKSIRIAIVEDDKPVREGLRRMIEETPGYECVTSVGSGEEALVRIPPLEPDIVLMDIKLPGISGIACIAGLSALLPKVQILMLTVFEDPDRIFQSLRAGAMGYLLKQTPKQKLLEAIKDLYEQRSPVSPEIARRLVEFFQRTNPLLATMACLSPREREVLTALARGLIYKEIAAELGISIETIRTHLHNIYKKLQVRSRTEAVMKVFGSGLA